MSSNEGVVDSLHSAKFHVDYRLARAFNRRSKLSASSANARIFSFEDPAYMPRPGFYTLCFKNVSKDMHCVKHTIF